jgi:hypothetical protein
MKNKILNLCLGFTLTASSMQAQMNFAPPANNPFAMEVSFTDVSLPIATQGFRSKTTFVDIDGDGDKDCFAGIDGFVNNVSTRYLENVGNANHPVFVDKGVAFPIFTGNQPAFADLDNDGDQDAVIDFDYYENIGSPTNPVFEKKALFFDKQIEIRLRYNTAFETVDPDFFVANVTLVDIDGDGDLDYFVGGYYTPAPIYFARNTGTPTQPKFTAENNNPFGLNTGAGENTLTFTDFDNDNDLDAVVGTGNMGGPGNNLVFYRNIGSVTNPSFTNIGSNLFGLSMNSTDDYGLISFTDIDNDGDKDAFLAAGKFYRNTTNNANAALLPQTINGFSAVPQMIAGKEAYTINGVTGGASGNTILFYSSNKTIVQVVNNTLVPLKAGTATITAVQVGNSAYSATFAKQNVTVIDNPSKVNQTITGFNVIPNLAGVGSIYTITGVTGGASGKPIVYKSNSPSIAKIVGNQIVGVSNGYCSITASQAGNNDYLPAPEVILDVQVGPSLTTQDILGFPNTGLIPNLYPGQSFTITGVTGGGSGNPILYSFNDADRLYLSIAGNVITALRPKTGLIPLNAFQEGNNIYAPADFLTTQFKIIPDPAKINQTISNFTLPATPIEPENTIVLNSVTGGTSGNPIIYTCSETDTNRVQITGNSINFKIPGIYRIIATQAGSATHNPATPVSRTINVKLRGNKQYQQILNFNIPENLVIGTTFTIAGVTGGNSGNPILYSSSNPAVISVSGNVLTMLSVGDAKIIASQSGNASFYPAYTNRTIYVVAVAPLPQTIIGFNPIPDQIIGNTYTISGVSGGGSGNPINFIPQATDAEIGVDDNQLTFNVAGTYLIYAQQSGNNNYSTSPIKVQLVKVNKKPQVIQNIPTATTIPIGGTLSLASVTGGMSNNPIIITSNNPSIAQVNGTNVNILASGTTQITLWQIGDAEYENATPIVLTISNGTVLSIAEQDNQDDEILIYPNPTKNSVTVDLAKNTTLYSSEFNLYDLSGRKLVTGVLNNITEIDLSSYSNGIYLLNIAGFNKPLKIIKE